MSVPALEVQQEVCPNCGHLATLQEITGWCPQCTLAHDPTKTICKSCGGLFSRGKKPSTKCWLCRKEEWLTEYADELEKYIALGHGIEAAKKLVRRDNRPNCECCGQPIKGGDKDRKFCKRDKCQKVARSYKALKLTGLSPDVALAIATERVTVILSN